MTAKIEGIFTPNIVPLHAYFAEIARHSPIDITLYNIPMFASPFDVPTIRRLAEFPRIIGIKDSSGDISFMLRMMAAVQPIQPDFVFLAGWEAALVPMLLIGCHGGTNASSGVVPEVTRRLYDLVKAGRLAEARRLQLQFVELFDSMLAAGDFPSGFRAAAELRGFNFGPSRQPMSQVIDRARLQQLIQSLIAEINHAEFNLIASTERQSCKRI